MKINKLTKGDKIIIKNWPFGLDCPSKTSNVFWSMLPLIGNIVTIARGWGKDYWSIYCKIN